MKKIKNVISFVENLLGKLRKLFVNTLTVLFLMLITFGFLFSLGGALFESDKVETEDQILYLEPKGVIVDKAILTNDPFEEFEIFESSINQIELENFLKIIKNAGTDDDLKAIYLDVDGLGAYYTSALKIADALYEARENGKEIIAFTSGLGTTGYLMASQATEIILEKDTYEPVLPFGFSRVRLYQKDFFENIKVNMNVYAAGDFKSGPEGYTRNDMSETDRFAWLEFITPIWEKYKSKMEIGRGFESGRIQYIGDNYPLLVSENNGDNNETSLTTGLVDKLMSEQETRNYLIEKYGSEEEYERPEGISGREYLSTLKDEDISNKQKRVQEKNKIAIIHVEGAIVTGNIGFNTAGSGGIVKKINKARDDENVKGIVLRVNSPGGDVYASTMITNALEEFQSTGRPVITSMGDIAASGGVWVTTTSEEIWAENTTLTGSIGVYGVYPDLSPLAKWAGINYDGISMTKAGEIYDVRRGMNEEINKQFREGIENFYKDFVTKVANNREMDFSEVLKVAGGRIWRGDKALELGLVDKLGSLDDAINSMVTKLELEDYKAFSYNNEVEFEDYLNSLIQGMVPTQIQGLLNEISGLNRMFLSEKERYIVAYCFDCGLRSFE
ncbi:signal peptide peptidase SppA [Flavobacteriaceae bacterium]|nr:signal peptide peptidase SppA [Flavobacteriaceae bacterium]MDB3874199.1 signal peptide peptidase SppA [Flavobacteriaceae bacterium]MDB3963749.1 signal peptide peptidase SppA [Flavobacteriaceae bacterium]MDC6465989.1 signal peptide peptidase SppA [Flavobacteriaceae bacterium]